MGKSTWTISHSGSLSSRAEKLIGLYTVVQIFIQELTYIIASETKPWESSITRLKQLLFRIHRPSCQYPKHTLLKYVDLEQWEILKKEDFWDWHYRAITPQLSILAINDDLLLPAPPAYSSVPSRASNSISRNLALLKEPERRSEDHGNYGN